MSLYSSVKHSIRFGLDASFFLYNHSPLRLDHWTDKGWSKFSASQIGINQFPIDLQVSSGIIGRETRLQTEISRLATRQPPV